VLVRAASPADSAVQTPAPTVAGALTRLKAMLTDSDPYVRIAAIQALSTPGLDVTADAELVAALRDTNLDVRSEAALALQRIRGPSDPDATQTLLDLLADPEYPGDRGPILQALLASMNPVVLAKAVDGLVSQLTAEDSPYRLEALDNLARLGPAALPALPAIERLMDDADPRVRATAGLIAAGLRGQGSSRGRAILVRMIGDAELPEDTRFQAFTTVAELGPGTLAEATPELIRQLADPRPDVRRLAHSILGMILETTPAELPRP
jgi:HEAT repeat protein